MAGYLDRLRSRLRLGGIEFACDDRVRTFASVIDPDHLPELISMLTNLTVTGTVERHSPEGQIHSSQLTS
ncbi:hypothetical protein [Nocardia anaemiae]|uniref:hypothetical protein n=1 Tax=Nocardia anaemiae TaxID=263910 RepID=UPI0007A4E114|nr:hypothetical protein [Nocardia anaemiae]